MPPIYWTISTEEVSEGWVWTAHGVTDAGEEFEDDSAGVPFASTVLAREDAEREIQRKADLAGEVIEITDEPM
ncbi:hypothetical protein [Azospirillum endophyticum]